MARHLTVVDRVRREATTVTTQGRGHQFEIQLGHLCNNRCVFCSSGQLSEMKVARPVALDAIVSAIEGARAAGARRVTFLGGEPTLHKGFFEALKRTVELGFEEVVIFTNGVMFPHPGFIDRALSLGARFEWRVSIQGGDEAAHVAVTGRADSFKRIVHGLRRLRAEGQRVTVNLCVNEKSYRSLPEYPALVGEHGVSQLHVDVVRPSSTGMRDEAYLREIMPRYRDMAPSLREMLARFEAMDPDFDVNVGNLPYCVIPEWGPRVHHGGEDTVTQACDAEGLEPDVDKYDWHFSMRRHPEGCEGCVFRARCSGVYADYLALHGDDEFKAVSREALLAVDIPRRNLALLLAPSLDALRAEVEAEGWAVSRDHREAVRSRVELALDRGPSRVTLTFTPPRDAEGADAVTDVYSVRVSTRALSPDAAAALAARVERAIDRDAGRAVLSAARRAQTDRALARAGEASRRLSAAAARSGWSLTVDGARHRLRSRAGDVVDVLITVTEGDRPSASVDFEVVEGTPLERARPMVDAVIALLGAPSRAAPATP